MRCCPALRIARPTLGQVEPAVDEGVTLVGDVGGEHTDLAVRDLARRAGVLTGDAAGRLALLEKAGLVDHQHGIRCREGLQGIVAHQITQRVGIPDGATEHRRLPPRARVSGSLGTHPAGLAPLRPEQAVDVGRGGFSNAWVTKQRPQPILALAQGRRP
jgi:hypothetical protein